MTKGSTANLPKTTCHRADKVMLRGDNPRNEFGISFGSLNSNPEQYMKFGKEAEDSGYDALYYSDNPLRVRDPFVNMAATATVTKRVRLGTLVSPVVIRHPSVLANSIYAVNELSGGRAVLTVGAGDTSARRIGLNIAKLKEIEDSVQCLRSLLSGQKYNFHSAESCMSFVGKETSVPIYVVGTGPRMLRLSGRIADGTVINVGPDLTDWALEQVRRGADQVGMSCSSKPILWFGFTSIDENGDVAIQRAKPSVANYCIAHRELIHKNRPDLGDNFWSKIDGIRQLDIVHSANWDDAIKASHFIPDDLVRSMALAGTADEIVEVLRKIMGKGVTSIIIRPPSDNDWLKVMKLFASRVIPFFKQEKK